MIDLWPNDFGQIQERPAIAILKDQAEAIGLRTKGRVLGEVRTGREGDDFVHSFSLVAPYLGDYTFLLLVVRHSVLLYPLQVRALATGKDHTCSTPAEFVELLRELLGSVETKRIIAAILAQTNAVIPA
jgi:hypothetical protein